MFRILTHKFQSFFRSIFSKGFKSLFTGSIHHKYLLPCSRTFLGAPFQTRRFCEPIPDLMPIMSQAASNVEWSMSQITLLTY